MDTFPSLMGPANDGFTWDEAPRIRIAQFNDQFEMRTVDGVNTTPRQFNMAWPHLSSADKNTLRNFLLAKNATEAFLWTAPDEIDPIVVTCPRWRVSKRSGLFWTVEVEFMQEFDHEASGGGGGGGGGAPAWLTAGAFAGIYYVDGEAWLNSTLITDLTTILGGDFNASYLVPGTGYDMTIADPGIRGVGAQLAIGDLLTRLQAMDWAWRLEFDVIDPWIPGQFLVMTDTSGLGSEHYFNGSATVFSTDFAGAYNAVDNLDLTPLPSPARNAVASSNNSGGWLCSVNGTSSVLTAPQSTDTPDYICIAGRVDTAGAIDFYDGMYAVLRKLEWFPLQDAAGIEALATP